MNEPSKETSISAEVLEEVFNEIDNLDEPDNEKKSEKSNGEGSKLIESLYKFEKELAIADEMLDKKKKNKYSVESFKNAEDESVVHDGLTDSSDDEDNKYFEEKKYNDSGKQLKTLLGEKTNFKSYPTEGKPKTAANTWNSQAAVRETLNEALGKFTGRDPGNASLLVDPVLGMRIINPLVSSIELKDKMIGRVSIGTTKLKQFLESPASKESNWVTGGVIVSKSVRTSKNGNQYCIWYITDLTGDIKTVSVFLFGSAYKEHWKTSVGTVVGILNPSVMDNTGKFEGTLRVDIAQKILVMGASKDYGVCKSKKKNGENCTSVVNKSKCEFCIYHMKKEYNKACRRSDLQPPKIGRSLDNLRTKILGKNQICLGGKIFNRVPGKKSAKQTEKDERRLKSLNELRNPGTLSDSEKQKTKDILSRLSSCESSPRVVAPTPNEPKMIDLGFTVTRKDRSAAKAYALKYIKEHGPLKLPPANGKKTPEQISAIKRKVESGDESASKKAKLSDTPTNPEKDKRIKNGITEEFLRLMNSETRNKNLLKMAESEEREKYFNRLETKEKIENKMASTFKVPCKAVRCLKCNYKSFSASELCKKEKHPLKVVDAVKRFWKCKNCSGRTVCLELVPLHACKNCGSPNWEKASMMREKKDNNLMVEPLSLRGHEEQFLGSAVKNANLNLLVPDEPA